MSQRVSQERLNEIAGRRLARIGLSAQVGPEGSLEGSLPLPRVVIPGSRQAIGIARFQVVSHDQLRFLDPPLAALPPIPFYDCASVAELETRVGAAVIAKVTQAREGAGAFARFGLPASLDPERWVATSRVELTGAAVVLEVHPDGVRVARVERVRGTGFEVPSSFPPLDLSGLEDKVDLELQLSNLLPSLEEAARNAPAEPSAARPVGRPAPAGAAQAVSPLIPIAPPGDAPPLGFLVSKFGPGAVVTRVDLVQDYQADEGGYRLTASVTPDGRAKVSVFPHADPSRNLFTDTIDLARAPEMIDLVASVLGKPRPGSPAQSQAPSAPADVPAYLMPQPGEVWVMTVLIERDQGDEVRYVLMDPEGRPCGASRVLAKAEFVKVFFESRGNYRLQIVIDAVEGGQVRYRQLNAERTPSPEPRSMPVASLVATFQPEAAMYS